jgi:hypothetical protein
VAENPDDLSIVILIGALQPLTYPFEKNDAITLDDKKN